MPVEARWEPTFANVRQMWAPGSCGHTAKNGYTYNIRYNGVGKMKLHKVWCSDGVLQAGRRNF